MPVNFVNIPDALKRNASFCVWKMEKRSGRPTKVPYNPKTGNMAKTNDLSTFADFNTAMKAYAIGGWDGIGYRVSEGIGAIDIDHCIREDGSLNDVAASILGIFSTAYFEKSPSGTGLRGFFKLSPDFAYDKTVYYINNRKHARFEENYKNAKAAGIPIGAYWYSYAMSEDEARLEADVFLSVIKGKQFEFPVYFDVEEKKQFDLGKEKVSAIMRAFLEKVESAGYFVGLYGSASSLTTHTSDDIKNRYTIWLAHWVEKTNYSGAYAMWQYSEKGSISGISGNVDLDICTTDFPAIIKKKGLNGFGQSLTPEPDNRVNITVQIGGDSYKGTLTKV